MPRQNALPAPENPVWMVVASTAGPIEGAIIAGRLQSFGIPALVHTEGALAALGIISGSKVLVLEKYYAAALLVLEPDESIPWLDDGEAEEFEDDEG